MNTITVIAVNYNNFSYTEAMCTSLATQVGLGKDFDIQCIIVDNSTDKADSAKLAQYCENADWIRMVSCPDNPGYFGGLNRGLSEAGESAYVIIGNNDLEFFPDFCAKLMNKVYESNQLVICPDVVTADGIHQNPHVLNRTNWLRRFKFDLYFSHYLVALSLVYISKYNKKYVQKRMVVDTACEISMGVGACYILSSNFLKRIKSLYFPWFLYGEEACLAWQVRDVGGIIWYDPELVVRHAESASCSKLPSRVAYEFGREAYWGYRHLL